MYASSVQDQGTKVRNPPYLFENLTPLMIAADPAPTRQKSDAPNKHDLRTTTRSMQIETRVGSSSFPPMRLYCKPLSLGPSARCSSCCRRSSMPIRDGRYRHQPQPRERRECVDVEFFKNLLYPKDRAASSGPSVVALAIQLGSCRQQCRGCWAVVVRVGGGSQTDSDAR